MLTLEQLRAICPRSQVGRLALFPDALEAVFEEYDISSRARRAAFLAQFALETQGFMRLEENLYYTTPEALVAATKPRWNALDVDDAWGYLHQPERLANRIYANREGNGDELSGDGWRYRGRGLPHLTFRGNYGRAALALNRWISSRSLTCCSTWARRCVAGGWYWTHAGCNEIADRGDFDALTKRINGGLNGIAERLEYHRRALEALS